MKHNIKEREQSFVAQRFEAYSGPLPSPQVLKAFEEVVPGSAERLLKMAEESQMHRHKLEDQMQHDYHQGVIRSLNFALAIVICMGLLLAFAIWMQINVLAMASCITAISSVVGVIMYAKRNKKEKTN